jgi:hypothetical protein
MSIYERMKTVNNVIEKRVGFGFSYDRENRNQKYFKLTCLPRSRRYWRRRWSSAYVIHANNMKFIFRIGAEAAHNVEPGEKS